jgi:hypothetical protein
VAPPKSFVDANPQAGKDLQAIQQPLTSLSTQCTLPVSLPQLLGVLQGAQSAAAVPAGSGPLPGPAPYTAH